MRILLANKFLYPKGGAERAVLALGDELGRRGHPVAWFGMDHPDNVVTAADLATVPERDYHRPGARRFADALAMMYSLDARRRFARLLDRFRPDVVHAHNIYHQLTPSILDAARERGVPVVMTLHDYKLVCPRYDMLRAGQPCTACVDEGPLACARHRCAGGALPSLWLAAESAVHRARGSYDAVRLFVAPSRFLRDIVLRSGVDPERVRHVPNFAPPGMPSSGEPDPQRFVFAGRLSAEKGIETLLDAVLRLGRGHLVVCGDGPLGARIAARSQAAPAGRVALRGRLDPQHVATEIRQASFAVVPSEWFENAPFAVLEAMALGRAVLASDLGGLPELVVPEVTGELVRAGDVDAWTAALERALAGPDRMRRLGAAAAQRAASEYGFDRHVESLLALYREAVAA